jgi:uncharacterized protein DUF4863
MSNRDELIQRCVGFLDEIKNMTAGAEVEQWLNKTYAPGSELYDRLAALIKAGVQDGWAADVEVQGRRYRRGQICAPSAETSFFSIAAVYMDSCSTDPEESFRGDYHVHPYGEFNLVVPLNDGAMLAGPLGWRGKGWTVPAPASHHYPEVKGGALIALFFLPAGRISYDIQSPKQTSAHA